ncbi:MAG: hypothetical protein ABI210_03955 [Abditibacteriaceae bacterium]
MNIAEQWGLPVDFQPVRFDITEDVKNVLREALDSDEPVIVSITNRAGSVALLATPLRIFYVKTGELSGVGVTGCKVKEFPWEGITKLVAQQAADNLKIAIHYRTSNGSRVETGARAALGGPAVDHLAAFDLEKGTLAFDAIKAVWQLKRPKPKDSWYGD